MRRPVQKARQGSVQRSKAAPVGARAQLGPYELQVLLCTAAACGAACVQRLQQAVVRFGRELAAAEQVQQKIVRKARSHAQNRSEMTTVCCSQGKHFVKEFFL